MVLVRHLLVLSLMWLKYALPSKLTSIAFHLQTSLSQLKGTLFQ
jgi:hypothetical protein